MQLSMDCFTIIILLGAVQGYFLALVVYRNRNGNQKANRFLALLLLSFAISISNIVLLKTGLYHYFPYTVKLPVNIIFLFGPLFYGYVQTLISSDFKFFPRGLLHFVPAVLVFSYFLPFYLRDDPGKQAYVTAIIANGQITPVFYEALAVIVVSQIHLWVYIVVISRMVKAHQTKVKQFFSTIDTKNLNWINFFIQAFIAVHLIFIPLFFFMLKNNRFLAAYNILGVVVSIAIYCLGYQGLKQTTIFAAEAPPKYVKNALEEDWAKSCLDKLDRLMQTEKMYMDPELTLDKLAQTLAVSRGVLSQLLNDYLRVNFYDYINRFRVEEVKRLVLGSEKQHLTLVGLAFEAGFSSKTSFYRVFKRFTQMTPSEFIRREQHKTDGKALLE